LIDLRKHIKKFAILGCLLLLNTISCSAENLRVLVLLSDNSLPYQSFANLLSNKLPANIDVNILSQSDQLLTQTPVDLIVAAGMKAGLSAATQTRKPVLTVMIPKIGYEELLVKINEQKQLPVISAIYLDQPLYRQIDFIQAVLPKRHKIGLLYTPNAHLNRDSIIKQLSERDVTVITKPVSSAEKLFSSLDDLLDESDVLLAMPDNKIYNGINIRNILLSTYRAGIPFMGLSQSYVTAGALGAVFSTQEQIADQVAASILAFARSGSLSEPQYVHEFTIALNPEVARSLGIELPTPDLIRRKMNHANGGTQ
jgi:ABC-type uncharacterized transport system substrate-binding protein